MPDQFEKFCLKPCGDHLGGLADTVCCLYKNHEGPCYATTQQYRQSLLAPAVHHPAHYNQGDIEHCELVEDQGHASGYYFGQVTKYLFRAGFKPGEAQLKDLDKAHWYLARWVAWQRHGKTIWKIVRRDPEVVFRPQVLAEQVQQHAAD